MDDLRFGGAIRAARIRRGWRQVDLAREAGVSVTTVSRIELGRLGGIPLDTVRRVARPLEIRVEWLPRSRAADLDRLVSANHAALGEAVIASLRRAGAWHVRPEVSFSIYGERGIVDLVAWHAAQRALLVIELKTEVVDVGELLGTFDRKRRLARDVVRDLGWVPASVSSCLVIGDSMLNRRRIGAHAGTFEAAFPDDARAFRRWLKAPVGEVRALVFFSNNHQRNVRTRFTAVRRVRAQRELPGDADLSQAERAAG